MKIFEILFGCFFAPVMTVALLLALVLEKTFKWPYLAYRYMYRCLMYGQEAGKYEARRILSEY